MTRFKTVGRFGTLCGVLAIVAMTTGCPFADIFSPCNGFNVNDNNPCTTDTCRVDNDGDPVRVNTAIANCCTAATVSTACTDTNPCTSATCGSINTTTGRGTCSFPPIPNCCVDNDDCDEGEVCDGNLCEAGCDSDDDCPAGETCDLTTGVCEDAPPPPDCTTDADCDLDGDACTEDVCTNGVCSSTDVDCAAGEVCVDGDCVPECTDDADCADDGDACTTVACVGGGCVTTTEDCDDGVACTDDSCDAATGDCINEDNCVDGTCDLTTGDCGGCVSDGDCDDQDQCTTDTCTDGSCSNVDNTAACNDANACTTNDTCAAGVCAGTAVVCPAGQSCNASTGNCQVITCTTSANCNDNFGCTTDICNLATGLCEYTENDTFCEDNLYCTGTGEVCEPSDADAEAGTGCLRPGNPCLNGPDGIGKICNEATNACDDCTTNAQCNDEFTCTSDTCTAGTCVHTELDNLCPDPLKCDGIDECDPANPDADPTTGCIEPGNPCCPIPNASPCFVCNEATFVEGNVATCEDCTTNASCSDGLACTQDACNGLTGECSNVPQNSLCPNPLFCNGADTCDPTNPDAGADGCINALPAYPCANACNETTNSCFACTGNIDCSDGVACTTDTCDGLSGNCTHTSNCTGLLICNFQSGQCE